MKEIFLYVGDLVYIDCMFIELLGMEAPQTKLGLAVDLRKRFTLLVARLLLSKNRKFLRFFF